MKKLEELGISPTPWETICLDYNDGSVWSVEAHNGAGITEFDCNEEQFGFEEGFANAHLIAAAPELYKCLYDIRYWLDRLFESGNDDSDLKMLYERLAECRKKSHLALAKATGEEEE